MQTFCESVVFVSVVAEGEGLNCLSLDAAVGCAIIRECIFSSQSAARSPLRIQPIGSVGGSIEFE